MIDSFTEEHRMRISSSLKQFYKVHVHHRKGKPHSSEHRQKIAEATKLSWKRGVYKNSIDMKKLFYAKNPDIFKGIRNPFYGKHHTHETRAHWSKIRKGVMPSIETRKLWSRNRVGKGNSFYGKKHTDVSLRKILSRAGMRPNRFECGVNDFLDLKYPRQWLYCGDGSFVLDGRCPDFKRFDDKKIVILANGVYWHTKRLNRSRKVAERIESAHYKKLGYKVIFIWEDDFKNDKENILCSVI